MRQLLVIALFVLPATAGELGKTLRALRLEDRERRREALEALALGEIAPASRSEVQKTERALARFMSSRHPGLERALAFRAMGRLRQRSAYERLLDRLLAETDDRVLHAAEEVFAEAPPETVALLAPRLAQAKTEIQRAALVRMQGALPGPEAQRRNRIRARAGDHWAVRASAVHGLARDRDPTAFEPLIELLDSDDPALLTAAIESLTRLARRAYGRDVLAWKAWWNTRDKTAPLEEAIEEAGKGDRRTYAKETERKTIAGTYFGIPIQGAKVAFVFDMSASMRYKLPLALDQLTRAIKSLPSHAMFEVVFFNEHVWPWRGRLSHADPLTKELLLRHIPTLEVKSYTNLFDAMETALDLRVDEIFVISDGEPNRGRRQFPRDILRELNKLNAGRTVIHTISVVRTVDGDDHVALLKTIAEQHRGRHVARTLK
ncbi:MAG: HEAT repeat domain-containing protein [Planctomycetota bacterium]|jgi:hypothetical protein